MIIDWITLDERYAIGNAHRTWFKALYERTGMVEEHPMVKEFKFIRGTHLLSCSRLPHHHDVVSQLVPFSETHTRRHFVSHRWLSPNHPDPDGKQMAILRQHIDPDSFYWIDFTCLPQKPRTNQEEAFFRQSIHMLPSLMFRMQFIVLRCRGDHYLDRAWCFFELLCAHVLGGKITYLYEVPELEAEVHEYERGMLEATLAEMRLPEELGVTEAVDREAIQDATTTVATFSIINLVSHYMALGQAVSGDAFFMLEDRYYFLATCDFRKMLLWLFDKTREFGISLLALSLNEFDENIFVKMANVYEFCHNADVYALPKEITLDAGRLRWLAENRHSKDSATNLFYLLSSMVTPLSVRECSPTQSMQISAQPPVGDRESRQSEPVGQDLTFLGETQVVHKNWGDKLVQMFLDFWRRKETQVVHQKWGDPDRLSIEIDCPPGDPRPPEVFEMVIEQTGLTTGDFEDSGNLGFGCREYLVKPDQGAISRYRRAIPIIKTRLIEYYERGIVRGATW